jgi:hypothetical protein
MLFTVIEKAELYQNETFSQFILASFWVCRLCHAGINIQVMSSAGGGGTKCRRWSF